MSTKLSVIKNGIDDWVSGGPRRSLTMLSRLSGVPYSTLRRIYKEDCDPVQENIIPLCEVIFDRPQTVEILSNFYPKLASFFESTHLPKITRNMALEDSDLLIDSMNFLVFSYCITARDVTREKLQRIWGLRALQAVETLIDADVLQEEGEVISAGERFVSFSGETFSKAHLSALLSEYRVAQEGNSTYRFWAVDQDTYDHLRRLHKDYIQQQADILENASDGNKVMLSGSFISVLDEGDLSDDQN